MGSQQMAEEIISEMINVILKKERQNIVGGIVEEMIDKAVE